jgi:hypothetical protein
MKSCPRCSLSNPDDSTKCDCGYDFVSKTIEIQKPKKKKWNLKIPLIAAAALLVLVFGILFYMNRGESCTYYFGLREWPVKSGENWEKRCCVQALYYSDRDELTVEIFERGKAEGEDLVSTRTKYGKQKIEDFDIEWKDSQTVFVRVHLKDGTTEEKTIKVPGR